ncbi:MAG: DUF6431 domain-containing protein [Erysipelotrichaceae bacterium]|nr:DUF6431 domain-containing protein [Erysipelotrichaceae bacterium]
MITIYVDDFNGEIDQKSYDSIINNLSLNTLQCPICKHFGMKIHGYYDRPVKTVAGIIKIVILRVKCLHCGKTHAILLSTLVPYQSIQLKDQIKIIKDDNIKELLESNLYIDENDISRVKRNYNNRFKEMLASEKLTLEEDIIINFFKRFNRQFLQIKRGFNILCV